MNNIDDNFDTAPEWMERIADTIRECWHNHGTNNTLNWMLIEGEGGYHLNVAPVYQEVLGGSDDGSIVWTPFVFDVGEFIQKSREILIILHTGVGSHYEAAGRGPMIMIEAEVVGHSERLLLTVHLEPPSESGPREIIDTIKHEVRQREPSGQ